MRLLEVEEEGGERLGGIVVGGGGGGWRGDEGRGRGW